jgi:hypothetical protein
MNQKFIYPLLYILAGMVLGAVIAWMVINCCCRKECPAKTPENDTPVTLGLQQIDTVTANNYFRSYMNSPYVDTLWGFTINSKQFSAMKLIAAGDTSVHGFRIYLGHDSLGPVRIVVGTGSPDKIGTIYVTTDEASGPCPDMCDDESPIIDL